jgi:virginiamycin B lyase
MKSSSRTPALAGAFALTAIAVLAGCNGSSSGVVPNGVANAASNARPARTHLAFVRSPQDATGQAVVLITIPAKPAKQFRHTAYVSPSTQSMTIRVQGDEHPDLYRLNLAASSAGCAASKSGAVTCKKTLALPTGPQALSIKLYDKLGGQGYALASEQATVNIAATGTTKIPLALGGVINTITVLIDGHRAFKVPVGTPTSLPVQVNAYDVNGNLIIPPGDYTTPITIANSDQTGITSLTSPGSESSTQHIGGRRIRPFNVATIAKPGTELTLNYTGDPITTVTLTPTTGGFTLEKGAARLRGAGKMFRQYKLASGSDGTVITKGPDGALWFTQTGTNEIGRITTTGSVTEFSVPTANSGPEAIVTGPDDALWFTEYCAGKIGRLTTSGSFTEYSVPLFGSSVYSGPIGITVGSDNALWFTDQCGDDVGRMTTSGAFTETGIPTAYSYPGLIAAGPDGALWFTEGAGNVGHITTAGVVTEYTGGGYAYGITVGADKALWFTEPLASEIGRITTAGTITNQYPTLTQSSEVIGIAGASDGAVWFAEYAAGSLGRLNTSGVMTEYPIPSLGGIPAAPRSVVEGPDNAIWFTNDNGSIGRVPL